MVDRDHELGLLINALHRAIRDRVAAAGHHLRPAGIGKSRLVRELYRHAGQPADAAVCWRVGRCPPFGENVTYAALADIVKAEAGILDTDDRDDRPATGSTRRCGDLVPPDEAARLADALRPLVGLPGSAAVRGGGRVGLAAVPAGAGRRGARPCWSSRTCTGPTSRCCASSSCSAPRRADVPLLVLCTARPELRRAGTRAGPAPSPASLSISLPPLRDSDIATLYAQMFGRPRSPPTCCSPLVEVADGNPLYAHEYVRMLIERGALRQAGRGWIAGAERADLPDAGERARGHRQPDRPARRRRPGGAAGRRGGRHASSGPARSPPRWASRWTRSSGRCAGWSSATWSTSSPPRTMAGQPEFRFRHVLVRDVCYQRLPRAERVARHAADRRLARRASRGPRHRPGRGARPPPVDRPRDRPDPRHGHRPATPAPRARRCTGPPAGRTRCTRSTPPPATWPERALEPRRCEPATCSWSCSPPSWPFYRDGDAFLARRR